MKLWSQHADSLSLFCGIEGMPLFLFFCIGGRTCFLKCIVSSCSHESVGQHFEFAAARLHNLFGEFGAHGVLGSKTIYKTPGGYALYLMNQSRSKLGLHDLRPCLGSAVFPFDRKHVMLRLHAACGNFEQWRILIAFTVWHKCASIGRCETTS